MFHVQYGSGSSFKNVLTNVLGSSLNILHGLADACSGGLVAPGALGDIIRNFFD
ncbi:MAG: hypothetical protein P8K80_03240 [Phycisphaerales bacterium]|nr:hypothetical protein [Phycisphaerales bacterium]